MSHTPTAPDEPDALNELVGAVLADDTPKASRRRRLGGAAVVLAVLSGTAWLVWRDPEVRRSISTPPITIAPEQATRRSPTPTPTVAPVRGAPTSCQLAEALVGLADSRQQLAPRTTTKPLRQEARDRCPGRY